jgi:hypothetical protein
MGGSDRTRENRKRAILLPEKPVFPFIEKLHGRRGVQEVDALNGCNTGVRNGRKLLHITRRKDARKI